MNSKAFIRDAQVLIAKMHAIGTETAGSAKTIQQELDYLCNNMTNPSLPSAYTLVQTAQKYGYALEAKTVHSVNKFA